AVRLAAAPGGLGAAARAERGMRLDAAFVVDTATGRVRSELGPLIGADDALGLVRPPGLPLVLRAGGEVLIAGLAPVAGSTRAVVVRQVLDRRFADALKELLRTDVDLAAAGQPVASTLEGEEEGAYHPASVSLRTPGGSEVRLTMHLPADRLVTARRTALRLTLAGGGVLLAAALLFYWYTVARVTEPIRRLIAATERIAGGDLAASLPPHAPAELGLLLRRFNTMALALKETQDKLVHSAKLSSVGALVAGISHELNNPLLGLLGHAEFLDGRLAAGAPGREELDVILAEGRRMKRILADLRGFVRPGGLERAPVDLNAVAEEVLALVRHQAAEAGVACEAALHDGGVTVVAVPDQMRLAALNLALNARQATPRGGRVRVVTTTHELNGAAAGRLAVEDTGAGIAPEHLARVTEPFFSTKAGRMGLGLAICQEIATRHAGRLTVESPAGTGTRVTLDLPLGPSTRSGVPSA
ncbi:MAG: ATP-binding protein, partial [bacterium]